VAEPISLEPEVAPSATPLSPKPEGPKLSEVLPTFLDFMVTAHGWRGQTLAQNKATYRMFTDHCGDRPVQAYARKDLTAFYDLLRGLPALYSKKAKWRDLPLAEIAKRTRGQDVQRLTMKTVKRHFSALGRLFSYLKKRGEYEGDNLAHGFDFPTKKLAREKRKMWEGDPLTKLFASPVWAGCFSEHRRARPGDQIIKDERYWLPILGLYHGNRLEEFAQLRRADVKQGEDGIWFFNITDEGERQLKNLQSRRRVPVHPTVLDLGFLEYVKKIAPDFNDPVFPLLRPGGPDRKRGYYFTKWWTEYRKSVGVYERGLDYHSFRHGVTTKLYAAGVSEAYIDELAGHEGGGTGRTIYKKDMPLSVLLEAIKEVEWPELDLRAADPDQIRRKSLRRC
jgi:integrase